MGFLTLNSTKPMQVLKAKGVKFTLIELRRTSSSRYAVLHLKPYPGQDVSIAAGSIPTILDHGWKDAAFYA